MEWGGAAGSSSRVRGQSPRRPRLHTSVQVVYLITIPPASADPEEWNKLCAVWYAWRLWVAGAAAAVGVRIRSAGGLSSGMGSGRGYGEGQGGTGAVGSGERKGRRSAAPYPKAKLAWSFKATGAPKFHPNRLPMSRSLAPVPSHTNGWLLNVVMPTQHGILLGPGCA